MNPAIATISQTLADELGSQLEAVFLFGSQAEQHYQTAVSNTNLLLITSPDANIHAIWDSFQPLWQQHQTLLRRAPIVATRHALMRHLRLNPHLALHLLQHGKQLTGNSEIADLFRTSVNPNEIYAHLAQQLLEASAALSQPQANQSWAEGLLNRLTRQIRNQPITQTETAVAQFNTVHQALTAVINQLPAAKTWNEAAQSGPTSPTIPGLQAIYADTNKNILVFNQLTRARLSQINWHLLAQQLPQHSASLHITTVAHFCLMTLYDKALDLRFNKYQHKWGIHFLAKLTPSPHQILRQAARVPSQILVDDLPHSYLAISNSSDDELHKLIHDYQNRILNIQLENELLARLGIIPEKFSPPEPLPERDVAATTKLDAIFQHLEWWADFYQSTLQIQT